MEYAIPRTRLKIAQKSFTYRRNVLPQIQQFVQYQVITYLLLN